MHSQPNAQCACGSVRFHVHGRPLVRAFCHCTICQAFNRAPFADITIFRVRDIDLPDTGGIAFRAHRSPQVLQRGKCAACDASAIEYLSMPLMPKLVVVPSGNIGDPTMLPEPSLHMFYHRRLADADDSLPKYNGYWKSQSVFGAKLIRALLRRS